MSLGAMREAKSESLELNWRLAWLGQSINVDFPHFKIRGETIIANYLINIINFLESTKMVFVNYIL